MHLDYYFVNKSLGKNMHSHKRLLVVSLIRNLSIINIDID